MTTMGLWLMNMGMAASGADGPEVAPTLNGSKGTLVLIGTGCWLTPVLAAVLLGVR